MAFLMLVWVQISYQLNTSYRFNNSASEQVEKCSGYQCDDGYPEQFMIRRGHQGSEQKKYPRISAGIFAWFG